VLAIAAGTDFYICLGFHLPLLLFAQEIGNPYETTVVMCVSTRVPNAFENPAVSAAAADLPARNVKKPLADL
jgi:hypothetical protein